MYLVTTTNECRPDLIRSDQIRVGLGRGGVDQAEQLTMTDSPPPSISLVQIVVPLALTQLSSLGLSVSGPV